MIKHPTFMTSFLCFVKNDIRTLFSWAQSYLFTLRENEELTRVKECQTLRKEELRALRSIFHCEIQKKKN